MLHVTNIPAVSAVVVLEGGFTLHVFGAVVLAILQTNKFLGDLANTNCVVFSR